MDIALNELLELIREAILREIDIEDVGDVCFAAGSTHVMKTCSIGGDKYFLKFTDESLIDGVDPSLQILVEYLAYRVYGLYPGINIPRAELVYDRKKKVVGLATSAVSGKMAGDISMDPKKLARMLTAGIYVDIFLANWDVIGTGSGNVIIDKDAATRIDPGGSLTFRAQGGRKGSKFGPKPSELQTMLDPGTGAGRVFQYADLRQAGATFSSVSWGEIAAELARTGDEVSAELVDHEMHHLLEEWDTEVASITATLKKRHKEVLAHVKHLARQ